MSQDKPRDQLGAPVSEESRLIKIALASNADDWHGLASCMIEQAENPEYLLSKPSFSESGIWTLLCAINLDSHILEIGAGLSSGIHQLFPVGKRFCLADSRAEYLEFSQIRHRLLASQADIERLKYESLESIQTNKMRFDCIILTLPTHIDTNPKALLQIAKRLLASGGQILILADNRYSWKRFANEATSPPRSSGLWTYQLNLLSAGFHRSRVHALEYHDAYVRRVIPITGSRNSLSELPSKPTASLKQKLKTGLMAPKFIITAHSSLPGHRSILSHCLDGLHIQLQQSLGTGKLEVTDHEITRKGKLIIGAKLRDKSLIIKLPLEQHALESEANNAFFLGTLQAMDSPGESRTPEPLAATNILGQQCYVESRLPGEPLSKVLREKGRSFCLRAAYSILEGLWQSSGLSPRNGIRSAVFDGEIYKKFVQERIDTLFYYTRDDSLRSKLEAFFRSSIYGRAIPSGLCHGDFSCSNILFSPEHKFGLIDWETAAEHSIPALDAINFLDSLERTSVRGVRVDQTIPNIADRNFREPEDARFLEDCYRLYEVDPDLHRPLVYLRWLRHTSFIMNFWLGYNKTAQQTFIYNVAGHIS